MKKLAIPLILIFLSGCMLLEGEEKQLEIFVPSQMQNSIMVLTLEEVTRNVKEYIGDTVEVEGRLLLGFEKTGLFPENSDSEDEALWINFDRKLVKLHEDFNLEDFRGKMIKVRGVVTSESGHLMQYLGTIDHVYYLGTIHE